MQSPSQDNPQYSSVNSKKIIAVLFEIASVVYGLSPIDAAPDAVPIVGWLDDISLNIAALLNLYQAFSSNQNSLAMKIAKYAKWILLLLAVAVALIFGGLIAIIVAIVIK